MGGGMRGPGRRMQGGKRIENPGKVFKRLMAYIFKNYAIHFIFVLICIVLSVVASIQGTLFMQRLIDDYILPMIGQETPDFGNLFREIVRVAGFYLVGVAATICLNTWRSCRSSILIPIPTGISCPSTRMILILCVR